MELLIEGKEGIKVGGEKLATAVIDAEQVLAFESFFNLSWKSWHSLVEEQELLTDDILFQLSWIRQAVLALEGSVAAVSIVENLAVDQIVPHTGSVRILGLVL